MRGAYPDFLSDAALALFVRHAKDAAFELDDHELLITIKAAAGENAKLAVEAYKRRATAELVKLATENKRLREQLGKRAKKSRKQSADVVRLADVSASRGRRSPRSGADP